MMLEDKIKEYLISDNYDKFRLPTDVIAKDIAEIVEKENKEYLFESNKAVADLIRENIELKQQLDRLHKNEIIYHKRLAIKPITKDKIIKVLDNHVKFYVSHADTPLILGTSIVIEELANEILNDKEE